MKGKMNCWDTDIFKMFVNVNYDINGNSSVYSEVSNNGQSMFYLFMPDSFKDAPHTWKALQTLLHECHLLDCSTFVEVGPHSLSEENIKEILMPYYCCLHC